MGTLCGWASINENGKATGGQKGDQTGREVKTGNWYSFGQTVVLRFNDRNKAAKAATFMGYVNTGALNVRKQPDPDAGKLVSYPCIKQNTEVGVCSSATAPNGALWYYIYIDGAKGKKYGYVNAKYITAK